MKQHFIFSKAKADKTFGGKHGIRLSINPGENWITEENLEHLKKRSKGFQHFLKNKDFVLKDGDNYVRDETEKEKKQRLTILGKAKALFHKNQSQVPAETPPTPPADAETDLEAFKKSLKDEVQTELSLFKDALRSASVADEEKFTESMQKKTVNSLKNRLDDFTVSVDQLVEKRSQVFEKEMTDKSRDSLKAFIKEIAENNQDSLKAFSNKMDQLIVGRMKKFESKIKTAVSKAQKG